MLAVAMARKGKRVGVLDADITGPSAPTAFGVKECAGASEEGLYPAVTRGGIQVMSINLLLDDPADPVVWRGPVIAGAVKQFWTDVIWEDVDYLFVDMPPGTGDVPLTVFQSLPVDGIVIVTSPQDLVSMIVSKAVKMANMMRIPVLGFVENYSYLQCPDCGKKINVFGESHLDEVAASFGLPVLARLPIDPMVAQSYDCGMMETVDTSKVDGVIAAIENAE
jgi:Mrp family chromosome partitioning ATPase